MLELMDVLAYERDMYVFHPAMYFQKMLRLIKDLAG